MRKIIVSAAIATVAVISFAAPSQARCYNSYDETPHCFVKKVKAYDDYGNVIFRKITVCN
ncbi:hypothetical protein [Shinella zoogloeoides]|jgi:hypothetical protein|uniref:Uncharacterized protein n=1 Tax=Shinella zoogloeoides TaxID=352475 RepID=A0A6N8TDD2_SHIZO|nr:hypothetical protein [Shinella zoogloeoides]MXO00176.1 hypothetical protein [Shinella zoogloeoides]UEX82505.1 hypothetical protein K8M09_04260 [Shinella zoogloeoides]